MPIQEFVETVYQRYGMRPVVPFEFPIEVGDIGRIASDGSWRPITTVRQQFLSAPGRVHKARDARLIWQACSGEDVSFTTYARGQKSELVPKWVDAKPRAEIVLGSERSFLFAARRITVRTALEMDELIEKIRLAYYTRRQRPEEGRWYSEFNFVFAVGDAQRFTAILPRHAPTKIAVMSRGPVGPPSTPTKIAGGVDLGATTADFDGVNRENALGRFYRAYRLRPSVLERWREEPIAKFNGTVVFERPVSSFEETFEEV
jgi:hypothetical protein